MGADNRITVKKSLNQGVKRFSHNISSSLRVDKSFNGLKAKNRGGKLRFWSRKSRRDSTEITTKTCDRQDSYSAQSSSIRRVTSVDSVTMTKEQDVNADISISRDCRVSFLKSSSSNMEIGSDMETRRRNSEMLESLYGNVGTSLTEVCQKRSISKSSFSNLTAVSWVSCSIIFCVLATLSHLKIFDEFKDYLLLQM